MVLPEDAQHLVERRDLRIEHDEHDLGVTGAARAHLFVRRVRRDAARVADRGRVDAGRGPELPLRAPEAAHAEHDLLETLGERRLERRAEHEVALGNRERTLGDGRAAPRRRWAGGPCRDAGTSMHLFFASRRIPSREPPFYPKGSRRMEIPPSFDASHRGRRSNGSPGTFGPGARVTAVRRLPNAWAAAVHAVDVDDARRQPPRAGAATVGAHRHPARSRASSRTRRPRSRCSRPMPDRRRPRRPAARRGRSRAGDARRRARALVMTRLRGRDVLAPDDLDAFLDGLATTLHAVHAVPVPPGALGDYRPWGLDDLTELPPWSRRPDVWRARVRDRRAAPVPAHRRVLCHRDFHPGNVLWHHGRVSGVVDWTARVHRAGRGRRRALPAQPHAAVRARGRRRLRPPLRTARRPRVVRSRRRRGLGDARRMALARRRPYRHHRSRRSTRSFDDFLTAAVERLA